MVNEISNTAAGLASLGRNGDTMLMHVSPVEVAYLQKVAEDNGTSLTVNPHTGQPEAFAFLPLLFQLLAGGATGGVPGLATAGLHALGLSNLASAGLVGAGTALATGDIGKGLAAGVGSFGSSVLGDTLKNGIGAATSRVGGLASNLPNTANASTITGSLAGNASPTATLGGLASVNPAPTSLTLGQRLSNFGQNFANNAGIKGTDGLVKTNPMLTGVAALGAAMPVKNMVDSYNQSFKDAKANNNDYTGDTVYHGPAVLPDRGLLSVPQYGSTDGTGPQGVNIGNNRTMNSAESSYFRNINPLAGVTGGTGTIANDAGAGAPTGGTIFDRLRNQRKLWEQQQNPKFGNSFAEGGVPTLDSGSYIMDARSVSELGNGDTNAGLAALSKLGAVPIQGEGDGVSDSIPTTIEGVEPAEVSSGEAYFPKISVIALGNGDHKKGIASLKKITKKAQNARKKVKKGKPSLAGSI